MQMEEYPFANLNPNLVDKVKQLEEELRAQTKEEIVLLAYQHDDFAGEPMKQGES